MALCRGLPGFAHQRPKMKRQRMNDKSSSNMTDDSSPECSFRMAVQPPRKRQRKNDKSSSNMTDDTLPECPFRIGVKLQGIGKMVKLRNDELMNEDDDLDINLPVHDPKTSKSSPNAKKNDFSINSQADFAIERLQAKYPMKQNLVNFDEENIIDEIPDLNEVEDGIADLNEETEDDDIEISSEDWEFDIYRLWPLHV